MGGAGSGGILPPSGRGDIAEWGAGRPPSKPRPVKGQVVEGDVEERIIRDSPLAHLGRLPLHIDAGRERVGRGQSVLDVAAPDQPGPTSWDRTSQWAAERSSRNRSRKPGKAGVSFWNASET